MAVSSAFLGKLAKKQIIVHSRKRGMHNGSRQSARFGSSLEFSDFRAYQPGDDVRQIDWNVYGRTQKHYIKRFLDEQELSIAIYLDSSASMMKIDAKWQMAKELAASLAFLVLASDDRLVFAADSLKPLKRKGAVYSKKTYFDIVNMHPAEKKAGFVNGLQTALHKQQQLVILITDGLEPIAEIEAILKKIHSFKQEFWLLQTLAEEEISPDYTGDVKLIDSENTAAVHVSMTSAILQNYQLRLQAHNLQLEQLCRKFGGQYMLIPDQKDIQTVLFTDLRLKGLIK